MHQPRPHGQHAVGGELTDEDSAAVELLARRLTNLIQLSGVSSLRMVRTLPDGGYVIAQDVGGVFRVITHKPSPIPSPSFDGLANDYLPMLFSGVVVKAVLLDGEGMSMRLTNQARRRIAGYSDQQLPPDSVKLQRFRVPYSIAFSEFKPQQESSALHTQYSKQRATWYSGAMAEVMQIVGGYGRQDLPNLPDTPVERSRLAVPEKVMQSIRLEVGNVRLPGYTGIPDKQGQFKYDYKFNNTNAISFDADNKPWLLKISPTGVWAMPLPLVPASTTTAFREYMEDVGDDEILNIISRFGGMPSGESFPELEDEFEAWRRAGVIIKVCDVGNFYAHIMYSSTCGWSLNLSGSEGYNTCYDYDDDGIGYGLTYKIQLQLKSNASSGKLPPPLDLEDEAEARRLDDYLSMLYQQLSANGATELAIKYKLRRVDVGLIIARFGREGAGEVDYWSALELSPIASHTGSVVQVGRGYLYSGEKFKFQPQIKFPEPFAGGCVSHDFLPLAHGLGKSSYPNCDTIIYCYYIGNDLKVVKYFRDGRAFIKSVDSDYEDCMTVGSWSKTEIYGASALYGGFYTSDIDDRKSLAQQIEVTTITGRDLGFDRRPFFEFDAYFSRTGSLWRNRYYSRKTVTDRVSGQSLSVGLCIPYFCRNALIHAKRETSESTQLREVAELKSVRDPTSYRYWTNDAVFAWFGGLNKMSGKPYPKDGSPVWVELEVYSPTSCSDFADDGPWIPGLPEDYTWLVHPKKSEWNHSGGGGAPTFKPYVKNNVEGVKWSWNHITSISDEPKQLSSRPDDWYFLGSPDDSSGVFYRDAAKVLFGEAEYASISGEPGSLGRTHFGFSRMADHTAAHHFIGVINE